MAFFNLILDPDPERRAQFIEQSTRMARDCDPELHLKTFGFGPASGVAGAPAPELISLIGTEPDAEGALRLGVMTSINDSSQLDASDACRWLSNSQEENKSSCPGGFFLAAAFRTDGSLRLAADRWGLYPVYYTTLQDGAILIASSISFMAAEAAFSEELDMEGVCGLLMMNNLIGDRSIVKDVHRLPAGCRMNCSRQGIIEIENPPPPPYQPGWNARSREEVVEELHPVWNRVLRRLQPSKPSLLLLSGGFDSRMLAAGLKANGIPNTALSFGYRRDYEVRAARGVVRKLDLDWVCQPGDPSMSNFIRTAEWTTRWSSLSGGFSGSGGWGDLPPRLDSANYAWTGIALDNILGGKMGNLSDGLDLTKKNQQLFTHLAAWGMTPEVLASGLRDNSMRDLPFVLREEVMRHIQSPETSNARLVLREKLRHRIRFYLGGTLWRWSFRTWPLVPALEPEISEAGFSISGDILWERALQRAYFMRFHPELASAPIDTNSHHFVTVTNPEPRPWLRLPWTRRERRRYYRNYNPEHPNWRRLRQLCEPFREQLKEIFEPAWLDNWWPKADSPWPVDDVFSDSAPGKNLMALAWRKERELGKG